MLLPLVKLQIVDGDGQPMVGASMYFYATGTTTPQAAYEDVNLVTPLGNPTSSDANGFFPVTFIDKTKQYRIKVVVPGGDLASPLIDADPANDLLLITADEIADGAIETKLGYTPVDPNNAIFTNNVRLNFVPTELNTDDMGFRGSPTVYKSTSYTLTLADSAGTVCKTDGVDLDVTIPPHSAVPFPIGHYIKFINLNGTGNIVLVRGGGVQLTENTDGTSEDKTIPPWGFAEIMQANEDEWVMSPKLSAATSNFSGLEQVIYDGSHTVALSDGGLLLTKDDTSSPTWTIPPLSTTDFPIGFFFIVLNVNTGDVNITPGAGVSLYDNGSTSSGTKSLGQNQLSTITQVESNVWICDPPISSGSLAWASLPEAPHFDVSSPSTGIVYMIKGDSTDDLLVQEGFQAATISGNTTVNISFPIAFSGSPYSAQATLVGDPAHTFDDIWAVISGTPTSGGMVVTTPNSGAGATHGIGILWRAIGKAP